MYVCRFEYVYRMQQQIYVGANGCFYDFNKLLYIFSCTLSISDVERGVMLLFVHTQIFICKDKLVVIYLV